jgi:uncharacterized DUF497 family protein
MGPSPNLLYVIHAYLEDDRVRIISARKADRSEAKQYYRGLNNE